MTTNFTEQELAALAALAVAIEARLHRDILARVTGEFSETNEEKPVRRYKKRKTNGKKHGPPSGAVTQAIFSVLRGTKGLGTKGLTAAAATPLVLKRVPKTEPHIVGVMLANLARAGRLKKRGQRPHSVYAIA